MRIILADLRSKQGYVVKDTVVGGYGSRLSSFSRTTKLYCYFKRNFHQVPSVQMATLAGILAEAGHSVIYTSGRLLEGDVAIVLSSLVDYRNEIQWADAAREKGIRVGFVGLAASKLPQLFQDHADFVIQGEPEAAILRLAAGATLQGLTPSPAIDDLDSIPHARFDLVQKPPDLWQSIGLTDKLGGGSFSLMSSRSCPEFCTYCPHRIQASYRARSVKNIVDELEALCERFPQPYVVFRDPLFSFQRDRCLHLADEIQFRKLKLHFECETRLDRLDKDLLQKLHAAGLRRINFGVESVSPEILRKVARTPIAPAHAKAMIETCRQMEIGTVAFYILGFLTDTWNSISATIEYSIALDTTYAQFKLLTPYPGTPLWKQMEPLVYEKDWEKFNGFTPTFHHPQLKAEELSFLLGAAFARFYMRPSFLANAWRLNNPMVQRFARKLDHKANEVHTRKEISVMARPIAC
ncbi:MAG: radical SAM protein [Terriglobia bacterium]